MKLLKRMLIALLVACSLVLVVPVVTPLLSDAYTVEAASVKLNKTKLTLGVTSTYKLKIKGTSKKVTWSTSNNKVAKVSSSGKVTALKKGTATITAKVGSKKYKCKVTVNVTPKLDYKITSKKQVENTYYVEGKVYNKTNSDLDSAAIEIELYNKDKKKISTVYSSIYWIDESGIWKFKGSAYIGSEKVKSYKVKVKGAYCDNAAAETKFDKKITSLKEKSSYKLVDGTSNKTYTIKGEIKNKNGKKVDHIFATYALYDKSGNIVGTTFTGYYDGYKNNKKIKTKHTITVNSSLKAKKAKIVEAHSWY